MLTIALIKALIFLHLICLLGYSIDAIVYYLCNKKIKREGFAVYNLPLYLVIGGGTYAFYEMFFSISGVRSNITHFLFLFFVFLTGYVILCIKNKFKPPLFVKIWPVNKTKIVFLILIALLIILPLFLNMIMTIAFPQFDIDMIGHILIKAKLFTTDSYKSSIFIHDNMFANLHSRYPPFAGMFYNLLFLFGCKTIAFYQLISYFVLLLLGMQVYFYLRNRTSLWQALGWFFIFISTKAYISSQYIIDSTDMLLSLSFLLAVIWFLEYNKNKDKYSLAMCSVLVGISTLIKNEAIVFSLAMSLTWFWFAKKTFLQYLIILTIISLPWVIYRRTLPPDISDAENMIKISYLFQNLEYLWHFSNQALKIILQSWNSVFILLIPCAILLPKNKYRKDTIVFMLFTAFLVFVYFIIFFLHIKKHGFINIGFFRLLSHVYPMAVISLALTIGGLLNHGFNRKDRFFNKDSGF